MKCPGCKGEPSKVYPGRISTTLLGHQPYYDENGVYHDNNPNITTRRYRCSRGHRFVLETRERRPQPPPLPPH